jgi:hypothetical protein
MTPSGNKTQLRQAAAAGPGGHDKRTHPVNRNPLAMTITCPSPVFIGVRPKVRRVKPQDWCVCPQTDHVVEICSVSNCIADGPPIAIDFDLGPSSFYWATEQRISEWILPMPEHPEDRFCVCAYRAVPWEFFGAETPRLLEPRQLFAGDYPLPLPEPDLSAYQQLGYDVVEFTPCRLLDLESYQHSESTALWPGYGHSPLSCNGLAGHYPVNQYCLLDDIESAYQAGHAFGREQPEPGTYIIIEVLRHSDQQDLGKIR